MDGAATCDAMIRIQMVYAERPQLTLSAAEVRPLCDLSESLCERGLMALIETGFLRRTPEGTFERAADSAWEQSKNLRHRHPGVRWPSSEGDISSDMSYTLTLQCGCIVYVACNPTTKVAHTRIIEARGVDCRERLHEVGRRLFLWEMLPDPPYRPRLAASQTVASQQPHRR